MHRLSLLTNRNVPVMHTGFLSFISDPVTDFATFYTAMSNFINILKQLDQNVLPLFCDEGFYLIIADIYLKCPENFRQLIPCLEVFI